MSNTYTEKILRSPKSEAAKSATSIVSDSPTTKESKRSELSSSKIRSTTLKPRINQSHRKKTQSEEFFPTKDDNDDDDKKCMKAVKNRLRSQQKNGILTIREEKKLNLLYSKSSAAFSSVKTLTIVCGISTKKLRKFL